MNLRELYSAMETDRSAFLERGYRSSLLTIPSVLPREGLGRERLPQNYQSVGSRGVNNLSSKLMLTLFPSQLPFFRLTLDPFTKRELVATIGDEAEARKSLTEIEKNLSLIEETGRVKFEAQGWRPVVSEAFRHLVITGNGLIFDDAERGPQFLDLRKFVVERDPEGNILKIITKQEIARDVLEEMFDGDIPNEVAESYSQNAGISSPEAGKFYDLYTGAVRMEDGTYDFFQQIGQGYTVPGTARNFRPNELPLIPLRFQSVSGENYGSGYVEEYDGDLLSLEMLSRSVTEGALAAAKLLILVKPGASIRPQTIAKAPNGSIRQGDPEDVGAFRIEKNADFAFANQRAAVIEQRLQFAFLMVTQRNAERVTAEEVRFVAQELEDALGGVYSSLADSMQKPVVNYLLAKLRKDPKIPKLPSGVFPVVSTGLEAISRGHTASRLVQLGAIATQILGPEVVAQTLDGRVVLQQLAISLNLDPEELLRSEEELQAMAQEAQAEALLNSSAAGPAIQQLGNQ